MATHSKFFLLGLWRELIKPSMEWSASPLFSGISESAKSRLSAVVRKKKLSKSESLFHSGDKSHFLYIILSGNIKLSRETANGVESLIQIMNDGSVLGENSLFGEDCYYSDAVALTDAEVFVIPISEIRHLLNFEPLILSNAAKLLLEQNKKLQTELEHAKIQTAPQRIGCFILGNCEASKGKATSEFAYEKNIVASKLGMKPETFSRASSELKDYGVEINGKNFVVNDIERLADFVCSSCSSSFPCKD